MRVPRIKKKKSYQAGLVSELLLQDIVKSEGEINVEDDIFVDSNHTGSIKTLGHFTLGPNGSIKGDVWARAITIRGNLIGNIVALESVILEGGASLASGKISSSDLIIHPGCLLKDVLITTKK